MLGDFQLHCSWAELLISPIFPATSFGDPPAAPLVSEWVCHAPNSIPLLLQTTSTSRYLTHTFPTAPTVFATAHKGYRLQWPSDASLLFPRTFAHTIVESRIVGQVRGH